MDCVICSSGLGRVILARVVKSYKTMGVLLPSADTELLEQAERQLFERFWGMSMSELRKVNHAGDARLRSSIPRFDV